MTNIKFLELLKKSSDLSYQFAKEYIIDELKPNYIEGQKFKLK